MTESRQTGALPADAPSHSQAHSQATDSQGSSEATSPLPEALPRVAEQVSGWRRWSAFIGPAISVAILGAVVIQLRTLDWRLLTSIIPQSPLVWMVLAVSYLTGPVGDWVIFRRLWAIPVEGIFPLVKKMIGNELLLGYVGEVYFYDWARRHVRLEGSPFGAVKDVAILSALAGNIMTLLMLAFTWPVIARFGFGSDGKVLFGSIGIVLVTSMVIMYFRNGLLSLPRSQLWFVFMVHSVRLSFNTGLTALVWHLILPNVSLGSWLMLSTVRLLISRLPLIPNKDLAFAGVSSLLAGPEVQTSVMIAMVSMVIVATHMVLYIAMLLLDIAQKERNA